MTYVSFHKVYDDMIVMLEEYKRLGPLLGISLPLIEAFLPFLPLILFVAANSIAFGLFKGFLYSWLGTSIGSILVFFFVRKFGNTSLLTKFKEYKRMQKITAWIERRGFGPLFLLLCFPFSPTSIINIVAGLSKIHYIQFSLAVFLGKAVMIFSIAFVGSSLTEFTKNPIRTTIVGLCVLSFWLLGKVIERFLQSTKKNYSS